MSKRLKIAGISVLIAIPVLVAAQSATELQLRAQDLISRVQKLQAASASTPKCPAITTSLKRGSTGEQVTSLQQFLAKDPGVYPEAQVSGIYGPATEAAVKRWQIKYNVVSAGDAATTGFGAVGANTLTAIKRECTSTAVNAAAAPQTGGLVSVSPASGAVPLSVVVQAIANTSHVCGGGVYIINYGDGSAQSQITVPVTNCGEVAQAFSHVYRTKGTYFITLSSGGHAASVSVVVN